METQNMSVEQLQAEIAALKEANAVLATKHRGPSLSFKIGPKGGISLYGLGRFPVTLYANQWERLFGHAEVMREFIKTNDALLAKKPV